MKRPGLPDANEGKATNFARKSHAQRPPKCAFGVLCNDVSIDFID